MRRAAGLVIRRRTTAAASEVVLEGELDLETVPAVQAALADARAARTATVLDLGGLTFLDSTGVRLLLEQARARRSRTAGRSCWAARPAPSPATLSLHRRRRPPRPSPADDPRPPAQAGAPGPAWDSWAPCACCPARRTGSCSSWPPSSRAAARERGLALDAGRGGRARRRRGLRGGARRAAPTPRPWPAATPSLGEGDVLDGVADLLPRVEVEAAFADGSRLVVLEDPVRRDGAARAGAGAAGAVARARRRGRAGGRQRGRGPGRRHVALPLLRGQPRAAASTARRRGACAWRSRPA